MPQHPQCTEMVPTVTLSSLAQCRTGTTPRLGDLRVAARCALCSRPGGGTGFHRGTPRRWPQTTGALHAESGRDACVRRLDCRNPRSLQWKCRGIDDSAAVRSRQAIQSDQLPELHMTKPCGMARVCPVRAAVPRLPEPAWRCPFAGVRTQAEREGLPVRFHSGVGPGNRQGDDCQDRAFPSPGPYNGTLQPSMREQDSDALVRSTRGCHDQSR